MRGEIGHAMCQLGGGSTGAVSPLHSRRRSPRTFSRLLMNLVQVLAVHLLYVSGFSGFTGLGLGVLMGFCIC